MTDPPFLVRRLVVIDLYGAHGSALRRRLVLAELPSGAAAAGALGGWFAVHGTPAGWIAGIWLLGVAGNYLVLSAYAVFLARKGRLAAAVRQIEDYPAAARYYSVAQWRLVIPFLIAVLALVLLPRAGEAPIGGSETGDQGK